MGIRRLPVSAIGAFSGFLIWFAHFLAIYGFAALACAHGFADASVFGIGIVPLVVAAATVVALAATAAVLVLAAVGPGGGAVPRDSAHIYFWRWMTGLVAGLSLVAIAWNGLPVLFVPACQ